MIPMFISIRPKKTIPVRSCSLRRASVALSGIAGGSNRQLVWVAPLLLIPYLGWRRRSNRLFASHAMAAFALCIICLGIVLAGFSQPYAPLELSHKLSRTAAR